MKLVELSIGETHYRLRGAGLALRTGPVIYRIRNLLEPVTEIIHRLYGEFPVVDPCPFSDFDVRLAQRRSFRIPFLPLAHLQIDGRPRFGPFPPAAAMLHLQWGLNWCLSRHAHQYLILHSAVLERGGSAVLLPGEPGSGKSTLAAVLVVRGWRLLSDELALFCLEDRQLAPLAHPICLKNASIQIVRGLAPDAVFGPEMHVQDEGLVAHMRPPPDSVRRVSEPARPEALIFVRHEQATPTCFEPLEKATAMLSAIRCSFNYRTLGRQGFDTMIELVNRCDCRRLVYSDPVKAAEILEGRW